MLCKILGFHGATSQETHYVSATQPSRLMLCKIWGDQGGDYEECRVLRYKDPVLTSQEAHFISTTESTLLMLCKIWGFYGGDYEECRLLGYEDPDRTSQETHYVSTTESSRLMLCKIWGFHGVSSQKSAFFRDLYGLWDLENPTLSRQSAQRWQWVCQPYAPPRSTPQKYFYFCFGY
jgi:hypothetical protein